MNIKPHLSAYKLGDRWIWVCKSKDCKGWGQDYTPSLAYHYWKRMMITINKSEPLPYPGVRVKPD